MDDPSLVRHVEGIGDLARGGQRILQGSGPRAIRSANVSPSTNSSTNARMPSVSSRPWIAPMSDD
jgi:hypothetical protein